MHSSKNLRIFALLIKRYIDMKHSEQFRKDMHFVMKTAWTFVKKNNMDLSSALRLAWKNYHLKKKLSSSFSVEFEFKKKDGSVRHANGTMMKEIVDGKILGTGRKIPEDNMLFYDNDEQGFRSLKMINLISYK